MPQSKRHRVEFATYQYPTIGDLKVQWETVLSDLPANKFSDAIESVDKRLYNQYAEGVNIFELTDRQFNKLKKILNINQKQTIS